MSDNIKIAYSGNEIASSNEVVPTEENPPNPTSVTNHSSAEGSGAASAHLSAEETETESSSEGAIKPNVGVDIQSSSNTQTHETSNIGEANESIESEGPSRLVFVQRLSRLPVVRCSAGVYQQAKANQLLGGPVALMEFCAWLSTRPLALSSSLISSLLGGVCSTPVGAVDWVLCKGLDAAQAVCPCVAVPPSQMCGTMMGGAKDCVCCCPRTIASGMNDLCAKSKKI